MLLFWGRFNKNEISEANISCCVAFCGLVLCPKAYSEVTPNIYEKQRLTLHTVWLYEAPQPTKEARDRWACPSSVKLSVSICGASVFNILTSTHKHLDMGLHHILTVIDWLIDWLSSVLRPLQHSIGYMGDGFTGQKTQPTVSKYWRSTTCQASIKKEITFNSCKILQNINWNL